MSKKIDGVLLLNKASNLSSNQALQEVKRLFRAEKAGHTGTLDPLATGLLPICFGEATKFSQYLLDGDKTYIATLKFGQATTTGDKEGDVILSSNQVVTTDQLLAACHNFIGTLQQTPPMFSALKHEGIPLYQYARKGIQIERKTRTIKIYALELLDFDFPFATLKIHCGKGTYIRTLAEDLAKAVDSVAHLQALSRVTSGYFQLENAHSFIELKNKPQPELLSLLYPADVLVNHFSSVILDNTQQQRIKQGQLVQFLANYEKITVLSLYSEQNDFIGLGEYLPELNMIKALRLVNTSQR